MSSRYGRDRKKARILSAVLVFSCFAILMSLFPSSASAQWVWPISGTSTPDEMNTSFGPRINYSNWDFHDGIDFPAPIGTPVLAVDDAVVYREGPGGTDGYSSRHVVLRIDHPTNGQLYVPYLHLDSIAPGVTEGSPVAKGSAIGTVGDDDATYSHLHFEVRRGSPLQVASVHPIKYLPYTQSSNFAVPALDRVRAGPGGRTARLFFTAASGATCELCADEIRLSDGGLGSLPS